MAEDTFGCTACVVCSAKNGFAGQCPGTLQLPFCYHSVKLFIVWQNVNLSNALFEIPVFLFKLCGNNNVKNLLWCTNYKYVWHVYVNKIILFLNPRFKSIDLIRCRVNLLVKFMFSIYCVSSFQIQNI